MNRNVLFAFLPVLILVSAAFAQPFSGSGRSGPPRLETGDREGGERGGRFRQLMKSLNLDDEQKRAVASIMKAQRPALREAHDEVRSARRRLTDLIHSNDFREADIRAAAKDLGVAEGEAAVARAKMAAEIRRNLLPDQQKSLDEFRTKMRKEMEQTVGSAREHADRWIDRHGR